MAADTRFRTFLAACLQQLPNSWRKGAVVMTALISLVLLGTLYFGWQAEVFPTSLFLVGAGTVAAIDAFVVFPFQLWKTQVVRISELEEKRHKQELLDEISKLRGELKTMRIEMEKSHHARQFSDAEWQPKFNTLQEKIATKIREFSSEAEENLYRDRGNINRPLNPMMGGYLWPVLIDTAAHDLDHLKKFIQDYSRGKERS
jgi:hypothetical protein